MVRWLCVGAWAVFCSIGLGAQQVLRPGLEIRGMEGGVEGMWQQADERTKAQLRPLPYGLREVLQLKPWYFLELPAQWRPDGTLELGKSGSPSLGFLGEEVKAVIPEAARRPLSPYFNFWQVDYMKLVPVLVRAIQEQQGQLAARTGEVERLRAELEQLRAELQELRSLLVARPPSKGEPPAEPTPLSITPAWLGQNIPNPFEGTTTIPYYIPSGVGRAELVIRDMVGRELRRVELAERGTHGQLTVEMRLLGSGTYEYALVLDGHLAAVRQMTLLK